MNVLYLYAKIFLYYTTILQISTIEGTTAKLQKSGAKNYYPDHQTGRVTNTSSGEIWPFLCILYAEYMMKRNNLLQI